MVKVHKMFCIDAEYAVKLKNLNASALVNELLATHFKTDESQEHIKALGADKLKELQAESEDIQKQEKLIRERRKALEKEFYGHI